MCVPMVTPSNATMLSPLFALGDKYNLPHLNVVEVGKWHFFRRFDFFSPFFGVNLFYEIGLQS